MLLRVNLTFSFLIKLEQTFSELATRRSFVSIFRFSSILVLKEIIQK